MIDEVATRPALPEAYAAQLAQRQQKLRDGGFPPPSETPTATELLHTDYLDIYPKIWGREFGSNGIGKLREVALTLITEHDRFEYYEQDPAYFPNTGMAMKDLDIPKLIDQSANYQAAMEEAGVIVHRIAYPEPPVGPFGPMRGMKGGNELLVVRGGSIIEKLAVSPFGFGRSEYLALWAFQKLGIPPILTITGEAVAEAGPCFWLAEDVFVCARGIAFTDDGLDQLLPVVQRSTGLDDKDFTPLIIDCPGGLYFDPSTGVSHHPDMALGPLDVDKVICYPPGLDFRTWLWLKEHDYKMVEITREEQVMFAPANLTILEPGRVMMCAGATDAIARVRKLGIDVTEVDYSESLRTGGGLHCGTLRLWREPGPFSTDR